MRFYCRIRILQLLNKETVHFDLFRMLIIHTGHDWSEDNFPNWAKNKVKELDQYNIHFRIVSELLKLH